MSTSWKQFMGALAADASSEGLPFAGGFELTSRCNLRCKMCYVRNNDEDSRSAELSTHDWVTLARQARDAGMLSVLLTGGEVFLRKDFREIYEEISMLGLIPLMYTNGTLITPEIANWLSAKPPVCVEVTLYGSSPQSYKKVTGHADAYEKAVKGIDTLMEAGVYVKLRTTVVPDNAADYENLLQLADERSLPLNFCYYVSRRRDEECDQQEVERLSPQELSSYVMQASKDYRQRRQQDKNTTDGEKKLAETQESESDSPFPASCEAGKSAFWLTWNGLMTPCSLLPEPFATPMRDGFQNSWNSLKSLVKEVPGCEECAACSLRKKCWACPARLKNETGRFDLPAKYLCDFVKYNKSFDSKGLLC